MNPVAGPHSNNELALHVLKNLAAAGVEEICICAGARNAPLVLALEKSQNIRLFSFFEERDASFFALGRIAQTSKPVAVLTTSGTAVSETLSACVEGTYQGLPLIIVSADRPRRFRGSGAPQAIEQVGIFSQYAERCVDLDGADEVLNLHDWSFRKPIHINVCFEEPSFGDPVEGIDFKNFHAQKNATTGPVEFLKPAQLGNITAKNPLIIVGPLPEKARAQVCAELAQLKMPIYAEALSGLRQEESLQELLIRGGDEVIQKCFEKSYFQSVIRIGGVPTVRFWRDLEKKYDRMPVVNITHLEFSGLSRSSKIFLSYDILKHVRAEFAEEALDQVYIADQKVCELLNVLLKEFPTSEPAVMSQISANMPFMNLYLGNSLPIREWDLVGWHKNKLNTHGHRGANGIDGQVSGFLGWAEGKKALGVFGDLTALYNLSSLSVTGQLAEGVYQILVMNNAGGKIFESMFSSQKLLNAHPFSFEHWAKMFHWDYVQLDPKNISTKEWPQKSCVIEVKPDLEGTKAFWSKFKTALQKM